LNVFSGAPASRANNAARSQAFATFDPLAVDAEVATTPLTLIASDLVSIRRKLVGVKARGIAQLFALRNHCCSYRHFLTLFQLAVLLRAVPHDAANAAGLPVALPFYINDHLSCQADLAHPLPDAPDA
jgi:hypothetical protein